MQGQTNIKTKLLAGLPKNIGSIPERARDIFSYKTYRSILRPANFPAQCPPRKFSPRFVLPRR